MTEYVVATFYKFVDLPDFEERRRPLLEFCLDQGSKGSILLAAEGINATIAGTRDGIDAVLAYLRSDPLLADMTHKESYADFMPFPRMKVRLKREIVNLGRPDINPNNQVGTYIEAEAWNELISDPEVLLVDTRNDFEFQMGTFKGAVNPETAAFNQFPDYVSEHLDPVKHKKVAMFCTGGIRCEKATSLLLSQGFEEVYHLKDGILKYLERVPESESLWEGNCFVFDERIAIGHGLSITDTELCPGCETIISKEMRTSPKYKKRVFCPNCYDSMTVDRMQRLEERLKQKELAAQRAADPS